MTIILHMRPLQHTILNLNHVIVLQLMDGEIIHLEKYLSTPMENSMNFIALLQLIH